MRSALIALSLALLASWPLLHLEAAAVADAPVAAAADPPPVSDANDTTEAPHSSEAADHNECVLGSLICVHADLKPFLITALWLLFLVVLLLVFERSEHQQHHQGSGGGSTSQLGASTASVDSADGGSVGLTRRRSRVHRMRLFCHRVFVQGIREYLPTSCLQILLGLAFAGAFQLSGYHVSHLEALEPSLFFHFLLPIIIVNAGLGVEKRHFFFNLPAILAYAVLGTVIVALVIGYAIYGLSTMEPGPFTALKNVTKIEALTFGALISAVDPVAVLALFERMHLNKPLYITLFGESVLNDAVSVVLYNMFTQAKSAMVTSGQEEWHPTALEIGGTAVYSVHVAASGFIIGVACGFVASGLMRILPNAGNQNLAVLIVVVSGYISFFLAEFISASGILSTFVCSIVMSIYLANLTPISQSFLRQSTKSYAEISEGFIYLVMGVSALNLFFGSSAKVIVDVPFIFITLLLCVLLRFICVYGIGYLLKLGSFTELRASDFFILAYGGLRGAIALALSLMLEKRHFKYADEFFACTMLMVLLTCFINGITLKPLIMFAKIQVDDSVEDSLWDQIMNRTCDYVGFFMGTLTGYQPLNKRIYLGWNRMNDRYLRRALLKSKVYNEAQDEGIYELHRKIVADEFLKFATANKSLIDLNALRSDSMVYAIRRVSSMGNTGMVHSQSHRSLVLPPVVRQALSVGNTLNDLGVGDTHLEPCDPVLDMEALSNNLAKSERDHEDQQNHHMHFMRDNRIINPRSWQDTKQQPQQPQTQASSSSSSRELLTPNPGVKFSIRIAHDEEDEDSDSEGEIRYLGSHIGQPAKGEEKAKKGETRAENVAADDEEEESGYASRQFAHYPHRLIQRGPRVHAASAGAASPSSGFAPASGSRKISLASVQSEVVGAAAAAAAAASVADSQFDSTEALAGRTAAGIGIKKKSVSFATLSPDQGTLDPRVQMSTLSEHEHSSCEVSAADAAGDCTSQGRFNVRVYHKPAGQPSDDMLGSVPFIRIDDNEVAEPGEEFQYEVAILDSLPWRDRRDENPDGAEPWHRRRGSKTSNNGNNAGVKLAASTATIGSDTNA